MTACAQPTPAKEKPPEPAVAAPAPSVPPIPVAEAPAVQVAAPATPAVSTPATNPPPVESWTLKNGKLIGPDQPTPKLIYKSKDSKTGLTTTSTCFKYADFALEEVRATGEIGAAEINLRKPTAAGQSLCLPDFKGTVKNLPAIEGFLAGATPDFVIVTGADPAETIPQFQLISLKTMKQTYKSRYEPGQEIAIRQKGGKTSLTFHAPMAVKCELAVEGAECWKKVLQQNNVSKSAPLPDCKTPYAKAKVAPEEPAIVTMRAQVKDVDSPKVEFLGGQAFCHPEK